MRVLQAISSAGMYGAEAVVLTLCRALNRESPGSAVLAVFHNLAQPNLALYEAAQAAGVETHLVEARGKLDFATPRALRELAKSTDADLLHTHGYKADIYGYLARRGTALPLVSTCHVWGDTDLATRIYGWLDRLALRRFAAIAAVSEEIKTRLVNDGVSEAKIHLVRNGIDVTPFQRVERGNRNPLTVGFAARLSPEKGIHEFLQVAEAVLHHEPTTQFLVAGDGIERGAAEQTITSKGMANHVSLLGRRNDMANVYASMDVLLQSSSVEGLPITLLEAMSTGLPIVATSVGDVPALVENGCTGMLVTSKDMDAMTAAVLQLLQSAEIRRAMGTAGSKKILQNFSDKQMMETYLNIYAQVLAPGGSKTGSRA